MILISKHSKINTYRKNTLFLTMLTIENISKHIETIYKQMFPYGKKQHNFRILEYASDLGLNYKKDKIDDFFETILVDHSMNVPLEYTESVLFAVQRELIENLIISTYGSEVYSTFINKLLQHSNRSYHTKNKAIQHAKTTDNVKCL